MYIVPGSSSPGLSRELQKQLSAKDFNVKLADVMYKRFPDGENYVRIMSDLTGSDVLVVQATKTDSEIIELFLLVDAIREFNVKRLCIVIPYFGYARQDKKFLSGEPISARAIAKRIELFIDDVVVIDIHSPLVVKNFSKPVHELTGMYEIGAFLKTLEPDILLSPDVGAVKRVEIAANIVGCPWDYLEKTRVDAEHVIVKAKELKVEGKKVAIVDDIISTGGTIYTASIQLKSLGAKAVYAACIHGLFRGSALEKLWSVCERIISTDTVENETSVVSVAPEIAKWVINNM